MRSKYKGPNPKELQFSKKRAALCSVVCASNVGAHSNNRLMDFRLLMQDYTTVTTWGKSSRRWESHTLYNCTKKFKVQINKKEKKRKKKLYKEEILSHNTQNPPA